MPSSTKPRKRHIPKPPVSECWEYLAQQRTDILSVVMQHRELLLLATNKKVTETLKDPKQILDLVEECTVRITEVINTTNKLYEQHKDLKGYAMNQVAKFIGLSENYLLVNQNVIDITASLVQPIQAILQEHTEQERSNG